MFNASILKECSLVPNDAFKTNETIPNSFLEFQLEFNAGVQRLEVEYNQIYYQYLVEETLYEGDSFNGERFGDKIKAIIEKIGNFFKDIWQKFTGLFSKKGKDVSEDGKKESEKADELKKKVDSAAKELKDIYYNEKREFKNRPELDFDKYRSIVSDLSNMSQTMIDSASYALEKLEHNDFIKNNYINSDNKADIKLSTCGTIELGKIAKKYGKDDNSQISDIDHLKDAIIVNPSEETINISFNDFINRRKERIASGEKIIKDADTTIADINKNINTKINNLLKITNKSSFRKSGVEKRAIAVQAKDLLTGARILTNTCFDMCKLAIKSVNNEVNDLRSVIKKASATIYKDVEEKYPNQKKAEALNKNKEEETKNESAYIHGEPFNGNTLFANEDIYDFNRTEWLDLELKTEFAQFEYDLLDIKQKAMIKEALILTDPDNHDKLRSLKEAEEEAKEKGENKFLALLKKIWAWITSFFKKTEEIGKKAAENLDANNEYLAKNFEFSGPVKSKGDILAGMYRVQENVPFVPFDQNAIDILIKEENAKEEFFSTKVLPNMRNKSNFATIDIEFKDVNKIAEWCKYYYGAALNDKLYKTYEGKLQFSNDSLNQNKENMIKFVKNISAYTKSIEADKNKIEGECKKFTEKPVANNESYYSYLYGKVMTLAEAEIPKGDSKSADADAAATANSNEEKALKNYIEVYQAIFTAKITAAEFIQKEFNDILKAHIEQQGGKNKEDENKPAEGEKKPEEKK